MKPTKGIFLLLAAITMLHWADSKMRGMAWEKTEIVALVIGVLVLATLVGITGKVVVWRAS